MNHEEQKRLESLRTWFGSLHTYSYQEQMDLEFGSFELEMLLGVLVLGASWICSTVIITWVGVWVQRVVIGAGLAHWWQERTVSTIVYSLGKTCKLGLLPPYAWDSIEAFLKTSLHPAFKLQILLHTFSCSSIIDPQHVRAPCFFSYWHRCIVSVNQC